MFCNEIVANTHSLVVPYHLFVLDITYITVLKLQ